MAGTPLSYAQIEGYWVNAGGSASSAPTAAAIAFAESSGIPSEVQPDQPPETTGWGLWQITPTSGSPGPYSRYLDPATCAAQAVSLYNARGGTFGAWSTYNSGAYLQFMQKGVAPDTSVSAATVPAGGDSSSSSSSSAGSSVASLLSKLVDPKWWVRAAKGAIATLIAIGAIAFMMKDTQPGQAVKAKGKEAGKKLAETGMEAALA